MSFVIPSVERGTWVGGARGSCFCAPPTRVPRYARDDKDEYTLFVPPEINRYPPVPFTHEDRPVTPHFEHQDRIQTLNLDADALATALKRVVKGEVRFDSGSRALYATDASNYRQ